jgi:hypothetical protein
MKTLKDSIKAARRAGVPLVAIETAEPTGAFEVVKEALNGSAENKPMFSWDMVSGIRPCTNLAVTWANEANLGNDSRVETARPDAFIERIIDMPADGVVVIFGGEKVVPDNKFRQGLWNLRDPYKATGRTVVMFVSVGTKFETDLKDDIVVLRHELPKEDWLRDRIISLSEEAKVAAPSEEAISRAIDATLGLTEFSAEQVLAMSITRNGYDVADLWDRKVSVIEQTAGLQVWKGGETLDDVGGNENVKDFFRRLVAGRKRPRCVVFVDEIEKAMAGQGDTSGTNQEMLGTLLKWMQDKGTTGSIFVGVAGSGKSAVSKAIGNEAGIPTIAFDMSAMKGSLVGESGAKLRSALSTVDAIGQGEVLVIATCNKIDNLPPELRRRFTLGTFFFDLPTVEERKIIWELYVKKYGHNGAELPVDTGWTGAEIKQCCDVAYRLGVSLIEAAEFVVPVSRSAAEAIESLRKMANGRFLSASYKGVYQYNNKVGDGSLSGRKFNME